MKKQRNRKKELDRIRTEWRKTHRSLEGKVILYPDKPPEHINARGNKVYNWFWKRVLLPVDMHEIPALITAIKQRLRNEHDGRKIRKFRTMVGMADDAFQLKKLENIKDTDVELQYGDGTVYNPNQGIIYQNGNRYSMDFSEDEDKIIVRDVEGIIVDIQYGNNGKEESLDSDMQTKYSSYKNWDYTQKN